MNILWIQDNGLIITALEEIKQRVMKTAAEKIAIYALTYNLPEQFELWAESFVDAFPDDFAEVKKYVINNSNDENVFDKYKELFERYGFIEFKQDNIGICGGRQFAAEHFAESDHEYMIFFEDDMLFHQPNSEPCKSGFTTYHTDLFDKCIDIMENESLDYLKLCFSEFYGDNHDNWAWYNVPMEKKELYFPPTEDGTNRKATVVKRTGSHRGLPYAVGEYHYCNWPILFNKDGNYKIFLEDKYEHLYEQTWMSLAMNLIREGRLNPGSLLATAINHERAFHYDGATRRENEHYDN